MPALFHKFLPFFFLGLMIVLFVAGLFLLSQILLLAAIFGLILFIISWIRERIFRRKKPLVKKGRTFNHDDL